ATAPAAPPSPRGMVRAAARAAGSTARRAAARPRVDHDATAPAGRAGGALALQRVARRTLLLPAVAARGGVGSRARRGGGLARAVLAERCERERLVDGRGRGRRVDAGSLQLEQEVLDGHPLLLRDVVDALLAHSSSKCTFSPLGGAVTARRNARGKAPRLTARRRHRGVRHVYAPRPGVRASGSATTAPSTTTQRSSERFGAARPQPTQRRSGSCAMTRRPRRRRRPAGR